MKQSFNHVLAVCLGVLVTLSGPVSALRCYQCASGVSWSDCQATAVIQECDTVSQVSFMGRSIFLPNESRQIEPACVSVYARGTANGATGYAYVRQCFFNDKSMCSLIQNVLPAEIRIVDCDLCTKDLCNGANTISVAFSSVLLLAVAVLLWK